MLQLVLAYDGTDFQGFQRLSTGRSVQGVLEAAWKELTGEPARMVCAGRTDAGVHAFGQVVSYRSEAGIPVDRIPLALNGRLPRDVRIRRAYVRDDSFHARFTATERTYQYFIRRAGRPSVTFDRFSLLLTGSLDVSRMREAAGLIVGSHDFRSFGSLEPGKHGVRCLSRVAFRERGCWLIISITANAFLRGMARSLVAQFLDVGCGKATPEEIRRRLEQQNRSEAGKPAPPNGLYLAKVKYVLHGSEELRPVLASTIGAR